VKVILNHFEKAWVVGRGDGLETLRNPPALVRPVRFGRRSLRLPHDCACGQPKPHPGQRAFCRQQRTRHGDAVGYSTKLQLYIRSFPPEYLLKPITNNL